MERQCKIKKYSLYSKLSKDLPIDQLENSESIHIFWDHLVDKDTLDCLDRVELRDSFDTILSTVMIDKENSTAAPFLQKINICEDYSPHHTSHVSMR